MSVRARSSPLERISPKRRFTLLTDSHVADTVPRSQNEAMLRLASLIFDNLKKSKWHLNCVFSQLAGVRPRACKCWLQRKSLQICLLQRIGQLAVNLCGQACKGVWGMSRRQKAMKGVEGCEMPGGVVKRALIPGFLNYCTLNT